MDTLRQDLRYAVRMLAKSPVFTAVAVLTLALGVGANTAIFTVVDGVLLRPLPFPDPERLVIAWSVPPRSVDTRGSASHPDFADWREQSRGFEHLAAFRNIGFTLAGPDGPDRVDGGRASAAFFPLLRVEAAFGRTFASEDDRRGAPKVAVLGHSLWTRRFGSDPGVVGRVITLDGETHTVVGVLPAGFRFPFRVGEAELWTPIAHDSPDFLEARGTHYLGVVGRLRDGVGIERAQAELAAIAARLERAYPEENSGRTVRLEPLQDVTVGDVRRALLVLLGAVGLVLLIACANVANLLIARATEREKEIAIRTAVGASRARVARQLLTESVLLGLAGGAFGLVIATWGVEAFLSLAPDGVPRLDDVRLDGRVFAFTLACALGTGLLFGTAPAFRAARVDVNDALNEAGRGGSAGPARHRLRNALVVAEVALSLVLLVGAGLMTRSFWRVLHVDPGFRPERILTLRVPLPDVGYEKSAQAAAFQERVLEDVRGLPGVGGAAFVTPLPLGGSAVGTSFVVLGGEPVPEGQRPTAAYRAVSAGYFEVMGVRLAAGRTFDERDRRGAPGAVIVNETLARRFFEARSPIGARVEFGVSVDEDYQPKTFEVVGVVADVKHAALDRDSGPEFYVPQAQQPWPWLSLVVRTSTEPNAMGLAVRKAVLAVDPRVPVHAVKTLDELVSASLAQRRFHTMLLAAFAGVALVLSAVGLYGVMAFSMTQRTREIGIRMALGAGRPRVLGLLLGQGMLLVGAGIAVGLTAALALTRFVASLLFGVAATDPPTFTVGALVLAVTALVASYVPARRATRVDPMVALRHE